MGTQWNAGSDTGWHCVRLAVTLNGSGCNLRAFWTACLDPGNVLRNWRGGERHHCAKRMAAHPKNPRQRLPPLDSVRDSDNYNRVDGIRDSLAVRSLWICCDDHQSSSAGSWGSLPIASFGSGGFHRFSCPCRSQNCDDCLFFLSQSRCVRVWERVSHRPVPIRGRR